MYLVISAWAMLSIQLEDTKAGEIREPWGWGEGFRDNPPDTESLEQTPYWVVRMWKFDFCAY